MDHNASFSVNKTRKLGDLEELPKFKQRQKVGSSVLNNYLSASTDSMKKERLGEVSLSGSYHTYPHVLRITSYQVFLTTSYIQK